MVNILHICENVDVLEALRIVGLGLTLIKIGVPILLIVMIMWDFMTSIKVGDEDLFKKTQKIAQMRALAAIAIFFVPTFVGVVVNASTNGDTTYASCLNVNKETIDEAYINAAESSMQIADQNKSFTDYQNALNAVGNIRNDGLREQYTNELNQMWSSIESEKQQAQSSTNSSGTNTSNYPYYAQCDSRWGSKSYNGTNLCNAGCGYSSLAMALSGLNNDSSITPYTVHDYIYGNGISVNPSGGAITDAALVSSQVSSKYGVKIETLFGRNYDESASQHSYEVSQIASALNAGKAIVLLIPGHYIMLSGNSNSVNVLDPANSKNNGTYSIEGVYNKFYNYSNRCTNNNVCGFVYAVAYSK